jgi:hypothetical protein
MRLDFFYLFYQEKRLMIAINEYFKLPFCLDAKGRKIKTHGNFARISSSPSFSNRESNEVNPLVLFNFILL